MSRALLALAVLVLVAGSWWWLGRPHPLPPSPLAAGERVACVSYAPFEDEQSPFDHGIVIPPEQIDRQLEALARVTDCVRTYSTQEGLDRVPDLARKHGLKVMLGAWIGRKAADNDIEVNDAIRLANESPDVVSAVVVGNEVLLRGELSPVQLMDYIRRVRAAVPPQVEVTYADVWEYWLKYPEVQEAVDFSTIHILPYWEDHPVSIDEAIAHVETIRDEMGVVLAGKDILIGETGWPSAGRMRDGALPSALNQARFFHELLALLHAKGWRYNLIEAFDQPWKRKLEGTVGGHWGFLDGDAQVKFAWGQPLSNHPAWIWQGLGGLAIALLVLGAGRGARGGAALKVALLALATGIALPWWCIEANEVSLSLFDWARSCLALVLSVALPLLAALALAKGNARPSLASVLGRDGAPLPLDAILGWGLILTLLLAVPWVLAMVFDPRYRDFLSAAMLSPILAVALLPRRREAGSAPGLAELAFAAALLPAALYVAIREGGIAITVFNHQALVWSLVVALLGLALSPVAAWRATREQA